MSCTASESTERLIYKPTFGKITASQIERIRECTDVPELNGKQFFNPDMFSADRPSETKILDAGLRVFRDCFHRAVSDCTDLMYNHDRNFRSGNVDCVITNVKGSPGTRLISMGYRDKSDGLRSVVPLFEVSSHHAMTLYKSGPDKADPIGWLTVLKQRLKDCILEASSGPNSVVDPLAVRTALNRSFREAFPEFVGYYEMSPTTFEFKCPPGVELRDFAKKFRQAAHEFDKFFPNSDYFDCSIREVDSGDLRSVADKIVARLCHQADEDINRVANKGYKHYSTGDNRYFAERINDLSDKLRDHEQVLQSALEEVQKRSAMLTQISGNAGVANAGKSTAHLFA